MCRFFSFLRLILLCLRLFLLFRGLCRQLLRLLLFPLLVFDIPSLMRFAIVSAVPIGVAIGAQMLLTLLAIPLRGDIIAELAVTLPRDRNVAVGADAHDREEEKR